MKAKPGTDGELHGKRPEVAFMAAAAIAALDTKGMLGEASPSFVGGACTDGVIESLGPDVKSDDNGLPSGAEGTEA